MESYKAASKIQLIVILDNIRSLNNIGSVFRTSDAFLIEKIYLCGITACPPHRDIHKTALGATDSVSWEYRESTLDLVRELRAKDIKVISVEQTEHSVLLHDFEVPEDERTAIVFGNEVKGVQQEVVDQCDGCIEIPQFGTKHSLNVSVSCGVVLWDLYSKMKL